jgi:hypothetical protein
MLGLFGGKDWNVVAIIFERPDLFRVNGNRGKGGEAVKIRDAVKGHERTIFWGVFDQKGAFLEGATGQGATNVPSPVVQKLTREMATLSTVREVLAILEKGKEAKVAKPLAWGGYPPKPEHRA